MKSITFTRSLTGVSGVIYWTVHWIYTYFIKVSQVILQAIVKQAWLQWSGNKISISSLARIAYVSVSLWLDTHPHINGDFLLILRRLIAFVCLIMQILIMGPITPPPPPPLDYRLQNTILASKCLQCKINNWQRVTGYRLIIGCRRRLKQCNSVADSLVISSGLNENHGLNPWKKLNEMWAHYWHPFTRSVSVVFSSFAIAGKTKMLIYVWWNTWDNSSCQCQQCHLWMH